MLIHADISSLPASRELDALVAEKVMGVDVVWVRTLPNGRIPERPLLQESVCTEQGAFPVLRSALGYSAVTLEEDDFPSPYSTSIAAAWEVIQCVTAQTGHWIMLSHGCGVEWQAQFTMCEVAHADTAPLAICRAALKAVGDT